MAETIDPARLLGAMTAAIRDERAVPARLASSRETLDELRERKLDPVAPRLARWVLALLLRRANHDAVLAEQEARTAKVLRVARDGREVSLDDVVVSLVRGAPDAPELLEALAAGSGRVTDPARIAWARRGRMLELLGRPRDPSAVVADPVALATRVLRETDELAGTLAARDVPSAVARAAGHGVDVGWPRALDEATLLAPFRGEAGWLDVPPLAIGPLPRVLAPASFVRGFARIGERWADACAPRDRPLPLAVTPSRLDRHVSGALFASMALDRTLLDRLGLSRREQARAERQVAAAALAHTRKLALSMVLRPHAEQDGSTELSRAFDEHGARALGAPRAPLALALAVPKVDPLDESRLAGALAAATLADRLRERHDEDWPRNRRAVVELRHELGSDPRDALDDDACQQGLSALVARLTRALA